LGLLRSADANLTLSADDVTLGGARYRDLQAQLQLADGKLALNPFRAQAPEGAIVGGLSIDASSDLPPVAVTLRSPSISAGAVANLLGYPGGASGTMQVDAQLSGVGQSVQALKASLDGHVGMAMVNGEIQDSLLQGLIGAALDTAGVASFTAGSSQLRCLALLVDFRGGIGRVQALAADTSKLMLDGDGQVDLRSGTVAGSGARGRTCRPVDRRGAGGAVGLRGEAGGGAQRAGRADAGGGARGGRGAADTQAQGPAEGTVSLSRLAGRGRGS
jgi:AsmA protein